MPAGEIEFHSSGEFPLNEEGIPSVKQISMVRLHVLSGSGRNGWNRSFLQTDRHPIMKMGNCFSIAGHADFRGKGKLVIDNLLHLIILACCGSGHRLNQIWRWRYVLTGDNANILCLGNACKRREGPYTKGTHVYGVEENLKRLEAGWWRPHPLWESIRCCWRI